MRQIFFTALLFSTIFTFGQSTFFDKADLFFQTYVEGGLVKYEQLKNDPIRLNELVEMIENYDLSDRTTEERKAFFINTYNILVIKQVLDFYPVESSMKIPGFFDMVGFKVAGDVMTLDWIEDDILFAEHYDARLHFVLVSGSVGCPPLAEYAYLPEDLDGQIEARTQEILDINWYVRIYKDRVLLSKVFDWYKEDFLAEASDYIDYINKFRLIKIPTSIAVEIYEYDWSLNDVKKGPRY